MKRIDFVNEIEKEVTNHSVYIGTGNGEMLYDLKISDIVRMEKEYGGNPPKQMGQVFRFIASQLANQVDLSNAKVEDCSGMIVGALRRLGLISKTADYAARHFETKTIPVALSNLKAGDLVYNKQTEATHVGVYVGNGYVIESRGRDYGAVKTKLTDRPWVIGGSFDWWDDDDNSSDYVFTRNLKYVADKMMRGKDVTLIQTKLVKLGLLKDTIDGIYGKNTAAAVIRYQQTNGLTPDGIAGHDTITAMGFKFA